jgi:hypothetical protein
VRKVIGAVRRQVRMTAENAWSAALSQAKNEGGGVVCANVSGLWVVVAEKIPALHVVAHPYHPGEEQQKAAASGIDFAQAPQVRVFGSGGGLRNRNCARV